MKLRCRLFGHKWKYYKKSEDSSLFRVCSNCGNFSYKNESTPGWTSGFLQAGNYDHTT